MIDSSRTSIRIGIGAMHPVVSNEKRWWKGHFVGSADEPLALRYSGLLIVVGVISTVTVAVLGVWPAPHWFGASGFTRAQRVTDANDVRDTWLKLSAGVAAAFAALVAWGRLELSKEQGRLAKQEERRNSRRFSTDLFSRAVDQLGNQAVDVRLGGIYALEQTYRASVDDRVATIEVLAAYARGHLPPRSSLPEIPENQRPAPLPVDIQAAITVLGRLSAPGGPPLAAHVNLRGIDTSVHGRYRADLIHANLAGAYLVEANLNRANLSGSDLSRSTLNGASLSGANLIAAKLNSADLIHANLAGAHLAAARLEGADLTGANLSGASLISAHLSGADLTKANLREADLTGADLREADLTGADLTEATLDGADLNGVRLIRADLTNVDLVAVTLSADQRAFIQSGTDAGMGDDGPSAP